MNWSGLKHLSTLELIELIKQKGTPGVKEKAICAFQAFYFRFSPELLKKCEIVGKRWKLSKEDVINIIEKTFARFVKYPSFDMNKASADNVDTAVILYLFRIAQNLLADYWKKKNNPNNNPFNGSEKIIRDYPEKIENSKSSQLPVHAQLVIKALDCLSYKHKVIFLTYSQYEQNGFKLPRKLLAELRKELHLSQETIRTYKFEVFKKIKEFEEIYGKRRD